MRHRLLSALRLRASSGRIATTVTACAAAAALAAGTTAASAATTSIAVPAAGAGARPVLLLNGDRVVTVPGPGGATVASLLAAPGSGIVYSLRLGRHAEYIPADALPYLGHGLAASLFDLARLRRAETGGRLPVQVTFTGRRPDLPGVTITRSWPGRAEGYLTTSSARAFGAALARQFRADHARASYGSDGMFAGVAIALPGPPAAPVHPHFPMHTLTVTGTNLAGQPDTGDSVIVVNMADRRAFGDPIEIDNFFYHGTARFSVPAGPYWAVASFGFSTKIARMVVLPQFTVRGSQTRVHLAERSASSELGASTPRRSALQAWDFAVVRNDLHGMPSGTIAAGGQGTTLWVNPTAVKPSAGSLHTYTALTLASPAGAAGPPYVYKLALAGPEGIIPDQHWVITRDSLATVTERYYQDVTSTGATATSTGYPQLGIDAIVYLPVRLPGLQTEYMSPNPSVAWSTSYVQFPSSFSGGQADTPLVLHAGQKLAEVWNNYPLHPQPFVQLLHGRLARRDVQSPSAYRAGDKLVLSPTTFSDNERGHTGTGFSDNGPRVKVSGSYAVYQDGVRIAHGNAVNGIPAVPLSHRPAVIRFVLSAARRGRSYVLSPASQTMWTWRSAPQPGATVPPGWYCGTVTSRRCAVQPMLTLDYHVHGMALNGTTPPGRQVIGLTVGHLQLGGRAPITGATAQVSRDGGRTWRHTTVTPAGAGRFTISFTAPTGADVTLRVRAADAAGGSIAETIQDAYRS